MTAAPGVPPVAPLIPRIQVAGIIDPVEAAMAVDCGADGLGFPLRLPVHAQDTDDDGAARIISGLPPGVSAMLITYLEAPDEIATLARRIGATGIQLHGRAGPETLAALARIMPGAALVKSLIVRRSNEKTLMSEMAACAPFCHAFLTDTHDPGTGADGATGMAHDWAVSARLARACPRPLILAGGLNPGNVARAVAMVRPFGVDAHTGLEDADGRKDEGLVRAFAQKALAALKAAHGTAHDRPQD